MKRSILFVAILQLCLGILNVNAEILYNITIFEPQITDGYGTYADSINDSGIIVGSTLCDSHGWQHRRATLFDNTGNGDDIDIGPLDSVHSEAHAVSNNGIIVGESGSQAHATIFESSGPGNNIDLGPGYARAVNNNQQIVGMRKYLTSDIMAFLWDEFNGMQDLGTLGGDRSSAIAINNQGLIVGYAELPFIEGVGTVSRATLFDSTGGGDNLDLGTLGGWGSAAYDINSLGNIVGNSMEDDGSHHAALFDSSGEGDNIDLGGDNSQANAISDNGQIVGWSATPGFDHTAMLFDPTGDGNNIDLNTVIDPSYNGPHLRLALDINSDGWIVGIAGPDNSSNTRGFLLTPIPEPCTLCLLTLGGMALIRKRRY
ncbi:MAG: hypothetical protein JXD22_09460 [Sedimentisphaerales bacterium]|nr:hypothetical protein [Sedimentisphaerales bacterium]